MTFTVHNTTSALDDSVCHSPLDTDSCRVAPATSSTLLRLGLGFRVWSVASLPGLPSGSLERDTSYSAVPRGRVACAGGVGRAELWARPE